MRLICPNCGAQYEVADDAIPPGGRDVQCSNCHLSWFQTEKPTVPGRKPMQLTSPQNPEPADDVPASGEVETAEVEAAPEEEVVAEAPAPAAPEKTPEPEPTPAPQRKPLDDAVASILREEAALGPAAAVASSAVASSAIAKPPPTEAAKPPAPVTADETRQRIAQMTVDEGGTSSSARKSSTAADDSADAAHLRTVPSINEINATLRARAQASDTSGLTEAEKEEAVQRKGFRKGFFFILLLLAILVLPYIFADQITENLPQTTSFMASYVTTVDQLRVALNEMISGLTAEDPAQ